MSNINPEICKLLDNGWKFEIYKNALGSYTVEAMHKKGVHEITDDFLPEKAFDRMADKINKRGDYT